MFFLLPDVLFSLDIVHPAEYDSNVAFVFSVILHILHSVLRLDGYLSFVVLSDREISFYL